MTALERIEEIKSVLVVFDSVSGNDGMRPPNIGNTTEFLLHAFETMREIAIKHNDRFFEDEIDQEFEERMKRVLS